MWFLQGWARNPVRWWEQRWPLDGYTAASRAKADKPALHAVRERAGVDGVEFGGPGLGPTAAPRVQVVVAGREREPVGGAVAGDARRG